MRQIFGTLPWIMPKETEAVAEIFRKYGTLRTIPKNTIVKHGGEGPRLFYLTKGICFYVFNHLLEKPRVMSVLLPGCAMGDITCLTKERVNVTVKAAKNSEILVIPPDIFIEKIRSDVSIMEEVAVGIARKHEATLEGMIANSTLSADARLKIFLKTLAVSQGGYTAGNAVTIPVKLNNEELGMIIHSSRVTVNRIMSKWMADGLLKRSDGVFIAEHALFENIYDWHDYF